MQCKELEAVLEQEGLELLPREAREHLAECATCQDLLSDLSAIAVAAKRLPAEAAPPERIWVSLRAQLETEGIIHEVPATEVTAAGPWWQGLAAYFRLRALLTASAVLAIVAGSAYLANRPHPGGTANNHAPSTVAETPKTTPTGPSVRLPAPVQSPVQRASVAPAPSAAPSSHHKTAVHDPNAPLKPSPSESVYAGDTAAVLSQTENSLSARALVPNAEVDASLRDNLHTLNAFIAECEARLKHNPQDHLTRQYLNMAYQQKAELLSAMMDSGRSDQ